MFVVFVRCHTVILQIVLYCLCFLAPNDDTEISKCNFVASPIRDIDPTLMIVVNHDNYTYMSANDIAETLSRSNDSSQNITQLLALIPNTLDCDQDWNQNLESKLLYQVSNSNQTIKQRSLRMAPLDVKNKTMDQMVNKVEKILNNNNNNKVDVITVGYGSINIGIAQDCILNTVLEIRKQFGDIVICVETNDVNTAKESILSGKVNIISHNCSKQMLKTMSQLKVANIFNANNAYASNTNIENVIDTAISEYGMLRWNILINDDSNNSKYYHQTPIQRYPTIRTQQFNSLTV